MEIQIDKHEDSNQVTLNLLLTWVKDYTEALNEPNMDDIDSCPDENTEESETNEFIHSLLPLNGFLIVYDESKQFNVNLFLEEYLDHIMSCVVPELTYVLDGEAEYSMFNSKEENIYQIITNPDSVFEFLEQIVEETKQNDIEHYIIINQFFTFYSKDHKRFMKNIQNLLNTEKIHLVLITYEYELLNEDILKMIQHRLGMWLGSTKVSKALMGTNILCSPTEDHQVVYTSDFGETFEIKEFKNGTTIEDLDKLLDI